MATWIFTKKIINGDPIEVYNNGIMQRDFTYIDDIISGTISILDSCKEDASESFAKVYNIGNNTKKQWANELLNGSKRNKSIVNLQPNFFDFPINILIENFKNSAGGI